MNKCYLQKFATINIGVQQNNNNYIIISSHVTSDVVQNREIFVKQLPLISPRIEIDNVVRDSNVYGSINPIADAVLVKVTNSSIIFRADKILTHNGLADITLNVVEKGGLSDMIDGNVVKIAGIKNDGYGGLQYTRFHV